MLETLTRNAIQMIPCSVAREHMESWHMRICAIPLTAQFKQVVPTLWRNANARNADKKLHPNDTMLCGTRARGILARAHTCQTIDRAGQTCAPSC